MPGAIARGRAAASDASVVLVALAEIGGDDGGVGADGGGRAVGDLACRGPARRRGRRCASPRPCRARSAGWSSRRVDLAVDGCGCQQRRQLVALARVEPGGGLVEAEQDGSDAHGAGDLEPALVAVGQGAGRDRRRGSAGRWRPARGGRARGRSPLPRGGRRGRRPPAGRRRHWASACCAAPPAGSPAPSCRRTGGCSGRCGRRGRGGRCGGRAGIATRRRCRPHGCSGANRWSGGRTR